MNNNLIEIIDQIAIKFGIAIDWSKENVLPYLEDLVRRIAAKSLLTNSLWFFLSVAIGFGIVWLGKKCIEAFIDSDGDTMFFAGILFLGLFMVIDVFVLCLSMEEIITAIVAPELAFVNTLGNLF